jgi:hypothetical protein
MTTWMDARISLTPAGVQRAGAPQPLTARLEEDAGTGAFEPVAGQAVTITSTPAVGAPVTCTTDARGECGATFASGASATATATASTTLSVARSQPFTMLTDGDRGNSPPVDLKWVNARISILQSERNPQNHSHAFTATLEKDIGDGSWIPAAGEALAITLTGSGGAAPSPGGPFICTTDGAGRCTAAFVLTTPGAVTAHASSTLSVAGSPRFTVETDGTAPNSADATATSTVAEPRPPTPGSPLPEPRPPVPDLPATGGSRPPAPPR